MMALGPDREDRGRAGKWSAGRLAGVAAASARNGLRVVSGLVLSFGRKRRFVLSSGRELLVWGPVRRLAGLGLPSPWRKKGRPRITMPFAAQAASLAPVLAFELEAPENGTFSLLLLIESGRGRACYRFQTDGPGQIDLSELSLGLPEGEARLWVGFTPEKGGEERFSLARTFSLCKDPGKRLDLAGCVFRSDPARSGLEEAFRANLRRLDYKGNLELRREEIKRKETVLLSAPRNIQLSLGHLCNIDCIMCPTGRRPDLASPPAALMRDLPLLFPFLDRISVQGGEPLLYKGLREIMAGAADHPRLTVIVNTNGNLLQGKWLDVALSGRFGLNISIDAARAGTYERIRRKASWDKLIAALSALRDGRRGDYPLLHLSFCTMRSNYREMVDFVDLAASFGAGSVYFNMMEPRCLEPENKNESLFGDADGCRETAHCLRLAYARAKELGLGITDKVFGWIFPNHPDLVLSREELAMLPGGLRQGVDLAANQERDRAYWRKKGESLGRLGLFSAQAERAPKPGQRESLFVQPEYMKYDGERTFFCTAPFVYMNVDVENTYCCCHAQRPFKHMTYGPVRGAFDVWNHPLMQASRREMYAGRAGKTICHPRCPDFRRAGRKYY